MKSLGILLSVVVCNLWLLSIINNYGFKFFTNNNVNNNYNHPQLFVKHGNWMPGKRHNQTCDFIPEITCCKNTQNLHFEFRNRKLNKIDAAEELRKILKNKKLLLIGDSLMLEFYRGLAELLGVKTSLELIVHTVNKSCSLKLGNKSSVKFLIACKILLQGRKKFKVQKKFTMTSEKIIRKEISNHDFIFFNQGIHYETYILLNEGANYFNNIGKLFDGKDQ